jgi:undecaprenyl-diphosphatase
VRAPRIVDTVEHRPRVASFLRRRLDPGALTGLALTTALLMIFAALIGVGALLTMVRTNTGFANWDASLADFGAHHATATSTTVLRNVSRLGGYEGVVVLGIILVAVEWRRTRAPALVAFVALALGGQFAMAELTKLVVGRDRPDVLPLTGFSGSSFPSGHATAAATLFLTIAFLVGRRRTMRTKAVLVALAVAMASAVAMTRVFLGVHWLTDVLAGLLVGWAWFALCSIAFGGRLLHFGVPVEQAETAASRPPSLTAR